LVLYHNQFAGALFFILVFCFGDNLIYVGQTQPISYNDWHKYYYFMSSINFSVWPQPVHARKSYCMKRPRKLLLK